MKYYGFIFLMILFGVILYFPDINFIKMRETFQNLATMNLPLLDDVNGISADVDLQASHIPRLCFNPSQ